MASYFIAPALNTLRDQINREFPTRSKASDGWIGDARHRGEVSDHNPDSSGMVCALDITNDPAHGVDINHLTDVLFASRDHRIKYIIANRLITTPSGSGSGNYGGWVHYGGSDPHTGHFHLSVLGGAFGRDGSAWSGFGSGTPAPPAAGVHPAYPLSGGQVFGLWNQPTSGGVVWARLTRSGDDRFDHEPIQTWVRMLQTRLNAHYGGAGGRPLLAVDGYYGPSTASIAGWFQKARGMTIDGMVGPMTWRSLWL